MLVRQGEVMFGTKTLLLAGLTLLLAAPIAQAGPIESACLRSGRQAANRALCGCIQQVANQTLTRSDQKQAAKFFRDPARAQEIRQSDRRSHEAFWLRYKSFGETAETFCGGGQG